MDIRELSAFLEKTIKTSITDAVHNEIMKRGDEIKQALVVKEEVEYCPPTSRQVGHQRQITFNTSVIHLLESGDVNAAIRLLKDRNRFLVAADSNPHLEVMMDRVNALRSIGYEPAMAVAAVTLLQPTTMKTARKRRFQTSNHAPHHSPQYNLLQSCFNCCNPGRYQNHCSFLM